MRISTTVSDANERSLKKTRISSRKRRIALYSHDTQGLGHMRRNLAIATSLINAEPDAATLMISGAREINAFELPAGVDCVILPAISKDENGHYSPRSLAISLQDLIASRANIIRAALESFAPDVLIVDKVPLGLLEELRLGLEWLRTQPHTRCVLGLREVLDAPQTVYREWHLGGSEAAIRAYYDAVWVYGDPRVYDPVREYDFSGEVAAKVRYTGYLDRRAMSNTNRDDFTDPLASLDVPPGPLVLCMVGGGQDGERLADVFLQAELPPYTTGLVVTGPFMPAEARGRLCGRAVHPRQRVLQFVTNPEHLLKRADKVVAMGGYNTICEVLSFQKRALIVPRVKPRREQLIRAERLSALGLLDLLHPDDLSPDTLTAWLAHRTDSTTKTPAQIDFNGLTRLPDLLNEVLATSPQRSLPPGLDDQPLSDCLSQFPNISDLAITTFPHFKEVYHVTY